MRKMITAFILALAMMAAAVPAYAQNTATAGTGFTDISGHWAQKEIEKYASPEIFTDADKDGQFKPGKAITRGEFVFMLHNALDIKIKYIKAPDIKEFFNDVSNDAPYAQKLYDLVVAGIIEKRAEFKPEEALPRDEMIHYAINALKSVTGGKYALIKMMPAPFADDDKITQAYKNDIIEAVLLKIVFGRGNNMLYPRDGATRAEAATVTARLMDTAAKFTVPVNITPSAEKTTAGLEMKLTVTNLSKQPVTIRHSSGQQYDFALLDADRNVVYNWSADKSFIAALTETVIEAGKSVEFKDTLTGDAYNSVKEKAKYLKAYITGESGEFDVNPLGYETEIQ